MGLRAGLDDLVACKASALSTMERENKDRLPGWCQVSGKRSGEEERGCGEGLPTQMRPTDRTSRQMTDDALQGLVQGKLEQDGVGRPSACETPGYLACEQLGRDHHVAGLPAPGSAALSWHLREHRQAASPNFLSHS